LERIVRVPSSTSNETPTTGRNPLVTVPLSLVVATLSLSLVLGGFPTARADDLTDARDKVRKQLVSAKKDVAADRTALKQAETKLRASEAALVTARSSLSRIESQLAAAKAADAELLAQLKTAQEAAAGAARAEAAAQRDVEAQRSVIASVVRAAYQEQSNLVGLTIVLGADSPRDLASRIQWNNTIFDTTAVDYNRLSKLETTLAAAHQAKVATETAVADKRKASAANVAKTAALAKNAESTRAKVATLVAENRKLRASAEDELEASKEQYQKLQQEEARIAAKISGDSGDYANPNGFIKPVNAPAGSPFGMRFHPILHYWRMHWGTDFGASCGAPIRAMANGKVVSAGWTSYGFGNYTIISYGKMFGANLSSGYAHQSKVIVHAGQHVKQGQIVGYVGTTGLSTGCHLHLQIYRNGVRVNPMRYL
jgi:murein DD-endopeptidase MepM/ murein hydrolase activator NlpD